jgi:oligopeptide/dipeptide ABC transporter ATP-binding protein
MTLLEVRGLRTAFGERAIVDGVSFTLDAGEVLGIVGETGSGKSVTASALVRLLKGDGRITGGEVIWRGRDLVTLPERTLREEIRGREIAMIFQNPRAALNPLLSVGAQLTQVLRLRAGLSKPAARAQAERLLTLVHIADPVRRLESYPHELSGGMAQRVMIALALACGPKLLIADEPTTSLDVTTQLQIVRLLAELRAEHGMAVLLITHDLALASELCDRIAILYAGRLAELGPARTVLDAPSHPYTAALLRSRPRPGMTGEIPVIEGDVADFGALPSGCRFHPRCPARSDACVAGAPALEHGVACHHPLRSAVLR